MAGAVVAGRTERLGEAPEPHRSQCWREHNHATPSGCCTYFFTALSALPFPPRPARRRPWPYNRGRAANFAEVFGRGRWRRFLPVCSPEERDSLLGMYLSAGGVQAPPWVGGPPPPGGEQQLLRVRSDDMEHTL